MKYYRWLGLGLAIVAWLSRMILSGIGSGSIFAVTTLAPSHFQLTMSALSVIAIWLVSLPAVQAWYKDNQPFPYRTLLLSLWFVGDVLFYYASIEKYFFFLGMALYGTAHIMFALKAAPKGRITLKVAVPVAAILAWCGVMLTGEMNSTLLFALSFVYAQLLIMFVAFSAANAFINSFGDWAKNTLAGAAVLLMCGDLTSSIILFNKTAVTWLGWDKLHVDLVSLLFGSCQLLIVISAYLSKLNDYKNKR